jgi:hypothetical protein
VKRINAATTFAYRERDGASQLQLQSRAQIDENLSTVKLQEPPSLNALSLAVEVLIVTGAMGSRDRRPSNRTNKTRQYRHGALVALSCSSEAA